MNVNLPPPYLQDHIDGSLIFALPEALEWTIHAVRESGTLFSFAASRREEKSLMGRGPLHLISGPDRQWIVRHYNRGGAVARILGDRYLRLGRQRPLLEIQASSAALSRGVAVPRIAAAVVYPAGLFYRADVAMHYIAGSLDLASSLFDREDAVEGISRQVALRAARELIRTMSANGILHADLNAKNILLKGSDTPEPYLLDLDRCRILDRLSEAQERVMLNRLRRSLRKWERLSNRLLTPNEWSCLENDD